MVEIRGQLRPQHTPIGVHRLRSEHQPRFLPAGIHIELGVDVRARPQQGHAGMFHQGVRALIDVDRNRGSGVPRPCIRVGVGPLVA